MARPWAPPVLVALYACCALAWAGCDGESVWRLGMIVLVPMVCGVAVTIRLGRDAT